MERMCLFASSVSVYSPRSFIQRVLHLPRGHDDVWSGDVPSFLYGVGDEDDVGGGEWRRSLKEINTHIKLKDSLLF